MNWNGSSLRSRLGNSDVTFGYPKEGYLIWMDNLAILKDAKNVDNAKAFMNFVMAPDNSALVTIFARYSSPIAGTEAFLPPEINEAPELNVPSFAQGKGRFSLACPAEVTQMYSRIWTELTK